MIFDSLALVAEDDTTVPKCSMLLVDFGDKKLLSLFSFVLVRKTGIDGKWRESKTGLKLDGNACRRALTG